MDTRASYTLTHEYLWTELGGSKADRKPWLRGPLHLANGEETTPLGWKDLEIDIQGSIINPPAAVLSPKALAYGIVLGLDYIFLSTMQINVADRVYSFKSNPSVVYPFQPGSVRIPEMVHHQQRQNQAGKGPKPLHLQSKSLKW